MTGTSLFKPPPTRSPRGGRLCVEDDCERARLTGKTRCGWHWLLRQPMSVQEAHADARLAAHAGPQRDRVPADQWPPGARWCAGCQSMIPLLYVSGSRCRACRARGHHRASVARTFDLAPGEYEAMLAAQDGRCAICGRRPRGRRFAVDHEHADDGRPRGLLCGGTDYGCNTHVVGTLEGATSGSRADLLAAARRMVAYFETYPYERIQS